VCDNMPGIPTEGSLAGGRKSSVRCVCALQGLPACLLRASSSAVRGARSHGPTPSPPVHLPSPRVLRRRAQIPERRALGAIRLLPPCETLCRPPFSARLLRCGNCSSRASSNRLARNRRRHSPRRHSPQPPTPRASSKGRTRPRWIPSRSCRSRMCSCPPRLRLQLRLRSQRIRLRWRRIRLHRQRQWSGFRRQRQWSGFRRQRQWSGRFHRQRQWSGPFRR
jgi:hypothetical protein